MYVVYILPEFCNVENPNYQVYKKEEKGEWEIVNFDSVTVSIKPGVLNSDKHKFS